LDCVFCAIIAGHAPAAIVAEIPDSLAFCDLRQPHDTDIGAHVLVVPRRHVETFDQLDVETASGLMRLAIRVASAIKAEFGDSYSLWQSNGEHAFQEVPHVHLHILTRRAGDGLLRVYPEPPGVPADAMPTVLQPLALRLRARLAEGS
jgi:histidine triad (HIT) family protein